jgi:hypothetical protein
LGEPIVKVGGELGAEHPCWDGKVSDARFERVKVNAIVADGWTSGDPQEGVGCSDAQQELVRVKADAEGGASGQWRCNAAVGEPGREAMSEPGVEVGLTESGGPGVFGLANAGELGEEGVLERLGLLRGGGRGLLGPPLRFALRACVGEGNEGAGEQREYGEGHA